MFANLKEKVICKTLNLRAQESLTPTESSHELQIHFPNLANESRRREATKIGTNSSLGKEAFDKDEKLNALSYKIPSKCMI